jgi:hypothetical protein
MGEQVRFATTVFSGGGTTTGIEVPGEVLERLGGGRRPKVVVDLDGYRYRSSVAVMGGRNLISLSGAHRAASGLSAGDAVQVTLELDTAVRELEVPPDLAAALDAAPAARAFFDGLSFSHRRWHVEQVTGAKQEATRVRRVDKSVAMCAEGRKP